MKVVAANSPLRLSVIIPILNEAESITVTLNSLQALRLRGHEVIVVDGGSEDNTIELSAPLVDRVAKSKAGRARQMNVGAEQSRGDVLWFLHADTLIEADSDELLLKALSDHGKQWGRFNIRLSGSARLFRIIERMMNWRSRITGIATGDQGIFVRRDAFECVGGFNDIPLMEDIEISRKLKKAVGKPVCLRERLMASSRRWEKFGTWKTILLMWRLRFLFAMGVDANRLARYYR